jgi:predicted kinase
MDPAYFIENPTLCLVVGVPASGKTLLAKALSRMIERAAYISKDLIQSAFTKEERVTGDMYSMIRRPTFDILVSFADLQLSLGKVPIVDAPFSINLWRQDELSDWVTPFKRVALGHRARLAIVRCIPPSEEELKKRIQTRGFSWDRWKLDHWSEFLEQEPFRFSIDHDDTFEIISDCSSEDMAEKVLWNYLGAKIRKRIN